MSVAWDISHQEFTIEDHYYFSILKRLLSRRGITVKEIDSFSDLDRFDVLVLNYPEKPFTREDYIEIKSFLEEGGRVILLGYYNNEDSIADTVNSLAVRFGIQLNKDAIIDEKNNYNDDKYFVVAKWMDNEETRYVLMPCTASVSAIENLSTIFIMGHDTAKSTSNNEPIIAIYRKIKRGEIIVIGTCVFWDNYSIEKFDNKLLALKLLSWNKK